MSLGPVTITNLVKCKSSQVGDYDNVFAKRPMATLFACALDDGVVCQSVKILITSALWIQAMSKTRLICFSLSLPLQRNKLFDLYCKAMGWFLCSINFGLKWVAIFYFYRAYIKLLSA